MFKCAFLFYLLTFLPESSNGYRNAGYPGGCGLNVSVNGPLILNSDFSFPTLNDDRKEVYYGWAQPFIIACPGGKFTPGGIDVNGQNVNCRGGTKFSIRNQILDYADVKCNLGDVPRPALAETYGAGPKSFCRSVPVNVGYNVANVFSRVYTVCHNQYFGFPYHTAYNITKNTRFIPKRPEPLYNFYLFNLLYENIVIENAYDKILSRFDSLGLNEYLDDVNFLTIGHLAGYDEFVYPFQRDATYHFANTAPQWNSFRQGNWRALKDAIVQLVDGDGGEASVFAGTLKVATLTNSSGVPVDIYLMNHGKVPVPRWFWKLVYFKESNFGAIFFGYNNPYEKKFNVDAEFFTQICYADIFATLRTSWLLDEIDTNSASLGYMYACPLHASMVIDPDLSYFVEEVVQALNPQGSVIKSYH